MSSVTGGYYGDVEELTSAFNPDPYFKIGSLGYTSSYVQDTKYNISFDNLNLVFPLGTDTFSMEVWDKDEWLASGSPMTFSAMILYILCLARPNTTGLMETRADMFSMIRYSVPAS
jgi:hypothetical protein